MKWHFKELSPGDDYQGIRDGDIELFDRTRYQSVVREAIQNSMDARLSDQESVKLQFTFFELDKSYYPEIVKIEQHLKSCANWEKANEDDKELINSMVNSIELANYSCLEISDYNTTGMEVSTSFDSFARSRNVSTKNNNASAGSKGMGKAAYFAASYLHTLFVTSVYHVDQRTLFQGISRISTHHIDGRLNNYKGYFSYDFTPVTDSKNIPDIFKRSQPGTSIFVLGLWNDLDRNVTMIKELLNNFWLAILEGDLIVRLDDKIFNKDNVYKEIKHYFPDVYESGQYNSFPNPGPYIEAYLKINCTNKTFDANIPILGKVKFIIAQNEQFQGRIANFRKSKMLIYKDSSKLYRGYCGIFICLEDEGNEILKKLENATHTEWKKSNWKDPTGSEALKSIEEFLKNCIIDFVGEQHGNEITIPELDKLLNLTGISVGNGSTPVEAQKRTKEQSKPEKIKPRDSDHIPKSFHWLRSQVIKENGSFKYIVTMDSKKSNNIIDFEIFVGSDDKSGRERLNIVNTSSGSFDGSIIRLNLNKGVNNVTIELDDNLKHAIRLKEIKNSIDED